MSVGNKFNHLKLSEFVHNIMFIGLFLRLSKFNFKSYFSLYLQS